MVFPRQSKSIAIRPELTRTNKKRPTTVTNSKAKSLQPKRKKLTKVTTSTRIARSSLFFFQRVDLDDPSTTTITLRRSRRLTNKQEEHQASHLSSRLPQSSSIPLAKTYPLRSRLRRTSVTTPQLTSAGLTAAAHRSRSSKQADHFSASLSSMGLRNGKIVNLRSIVSGSTPSTAQEITTSTLPLPAFNPLPRHHSTTNSTTTTTNSTTSFPSTPTNTQINNNNNNNNNDLTQNLCQYHYSNISNHPSLEPNKHFPVRLDILLDRPPASREKQIEYGWNHDDRSMNIFVKHNDPCTFHRHVSLSLSSVLFFFGVIQPVAQSTDAVRCKKGFTNGIHVWEIEWWERDWTLLINCSASSSSLSLAGIRGNEEHTQLSVWERSKHLCIVLAIRHWWEWIKNPGDGISAAINSTIKAWIVSMLPLNIPRQVPLLRARAAHHQRRPIPPMSWITTGLLIHRNRTTVLLFRINSSSFWISKKAH